MYRVYADGELIFDPIDRAHILHSPKVTQEIGKAGTFQFVMSPENKYYDEIKQMVTTIVVEFEIGTSTIEIFRGRVFSVTIDFSKMKTVVCEGSLSYLVDSVQKAVSYKGKTKQLLTDIINNHNKMIAGKSVAVSDWKNIKDEKVRRKMFRLGQYEIENADVIIPGHKDKDDKYYGSQYEQTIIESIDDEWKTTYDYINDVIISYLGGYLIARYDSKNGGNILDVVSDDFLENGGGKAQGASRQIEFGVNLLDLSEELNPEELCTVVIPLGDTVKDKVLTIENSNAAKSNTSSSGFEVVEYDGKKIGIKHIKAAKKYGCIFKTQSFSNVNNADTLFEDGKKWLKKKRDIPSRFTVKAIDVRFVDDSADVTPIRLGEMISVRSKEHGVDFELLCTKIEYDLSNPANNAYTLGNPEQSLTDRYKKDKDKSDRKSKGRSGKSGASSAAAADAAKTTADDALALAQDLDKKLAGAEIKVDPDNASITLATWYKKSKDAMQRAGIDIDGKKGSVDIYAMYGEKEGKETAKSVADLKVWANEAGSGIELNAKKINEFGPSLASLTLRTSDLESIVEQLASYESETSLTTAAITAKADAQGSMIDSFAKFRDKVTGELTSLADLKLSVDKDKAEIKALAAHHSDTTAGLANLTMRVTDMESVIEETAKFFSESAITTSQITQKADSNGASIEALTEFKDRTTGELRALATTKQWVDDHSANIEQATEWYSKNGNSSLTKLSQLSDDKISQILQAAEFYTENSSALASIKTWSTETAAGIVSAAEYVNKEDTEAGDRVLSVTTAGTRTLATENRAFWEAFATWKKPGGKVDTASIKLKASAFGTVIEENADIIEAHCKQLIVDGGIKGDWIASGNVTVKKHLQVSTATISKTLTINCNGNPEAGLVVSGYIKAKNSVDGNSGTVICKKDLNTAVKDLQDKIDGCVKPSDLDNYATKDDLVVKLDVSVYNTHRHKYKTLLGESETANPHGRYK